MTQCKNHKKIIPRYNFWSHPIWRTDHGGSLIRLRRHLSTETKICNLLTLTPTL